MSASVKRCLFALLPMALAAQAVAATGAIFDGLELPARTRFAAGLNLSAFLGSPLDELWRKELGQGQNPFDALRATTGIDFEKDLDAIAIASSGPAEAGQRGLVVASGRFDVYALARRLEVKSGVTWKAVQGGTIYSLPSQASGLGALAFHGSDRILLGTQSSVAEALGRPTSEAATAAAVNFKALLREVPSATAFWVVVDSEGLAPLAGEGPDAGKLAAFKLPALQSLMLTGDLSPDLSFELVAEADDDAAARNLADAVRGFVALAALQAAEQPELQQLATAVNVSASGRRLKATARVRYELLEKLKSRSAKVTAPTKGGSSVKP